MYTINRPKQRHIFLVYISFSCGLISLSKGWSKLIDFKVCMQAFNPPLLYSDFHGALAVLYKYLSDQSCLP